MVPLFETPARHAPLPFSPDILPTRRDTGKWNGASISPAFDHYCSGFFLKDRNSNFDPFLLSIATLYDARSLPSCRRTSFFL